MVTYGALSDEIKHMGSKSDSQWLLLSERVGEVTGQQKAGLKNYANKNLKEILITLINLLTLTVRGFKF